MAVDPSQVDRILNTSLLDHMAAAAELQANPPTGPGSTAGELLSRRILWRLAIQNELTWALVKKS